MALGHCAFALGGCIGTPPAGKVCPFVRPDELTLSPLLVVDQFGYLPDSKKVAVARGPYAGFDEHLRWVRYDFLSKEVELRRKELTTLFT